MATPTADMLRPRSARPASQPSEALDPPGPFDTQQEDLTEILGAFNQVTENLSRSHDALQKQVSNLRRQLVSTDAQLQRSKRLAALGAMAAGIAHEIRNPLAAIQLYAAMLASDLDPQHANPTDPAALASTARKIESAVRGLNAIVTDVLSFAREIRPRPRWVPIDTLFDRAIESSRPAIEAASVTVAAAPIDPNPNNDRLQAWIDPPLLNQALLNLIRNAVDAMAQQSRDSDPPRRLSLSARLEDAQIVLTVRDNGPGIDDDDIDRIFNPFFTTRSTGTGLGLAIVHRIVDAHHGGIVVYNDGGAVFELSLPLPLHDQDTPPKRAHGVTAHE